MKDGIQGCFTVFTCQPTRAVAAYLKVVRRREPSSAEDTRGGLFPLSFGGFRGLPREKKNLSASLCVFNGFLCVLDQILVVLVTKIFLVA